MEERGLSPELTDQDRVFLVFSYLGPLGFLPLAASRREFVKWHAKQGLLFSATIAAGYLLLKAVHLAFRRWLWAWVGELYWIAVAMVGLGALLVLLLCVSRALEGERFKIPLLGDLTDRF